jgi:hypothetical protein
MNKTIFKISPKVLFIITALVAGLLVFVWLHWRGNRQTELIVFSVLTVLALTLYTLRSELSLSVTSREICGKLTWLGLAIRKTVVRVGSDDALHLTEEISHGRQRIFVWHQLEATGELASPRSDAPGPYVLASQTWLPNRVKLEDFSAKASQFLGVALEDSRKFTERVSKFRAEVK